MALTQGNALDTLYSSSIINEQLKNSEIKEVNVNQLYEFAGHTYKVIENEDMEELTESIRINGVIEPLIVRVHPSGIGYEIISGHRRKVAAVKAGKLQVPVHVVDLSDDEAVVAMVDANIRRKNILPSELAFSLKAKSEALSHLGKATGELHTSSQIGAEIGKTGRTVENYIRLTYLDENLLALVDEKRIGVSVGCILSFLPEDEQYKVYEICADNKIKPSVEQAQELKDHKDALSEEFIINVLCQRKEKTKKNFSINNEKLKKYFSADADDVKKEQIILAALEEYYKNHGTK